MKRTPEQLEAITTVGASLCVDAAAGSGKTSVLVERILHIIDQRLADLDQIVAITFTDNAASEMKDRLRRECRRRAPQDDPQAMSFWRDIERRVETARISTIHGFCARLLRENALALGLDPDFTVLSEPESLLLRNQAITDGLNELLDQGEPAALRVVAEYGLRDVRVMLEHMLKEAVSLMRLGRELPFDDPGQLHERFIALAQECFERRLRDFAHSRETREALEELRTFEGRCKQAKDPREKLRLVMIGSLQSIIDGALAPHEMEERLRRIQEVEVKGHKKANWESPDCVERLKSLQDGVKGKVKALLEFCGDDVMASACAAMTCDAFKVFRHLEAYHRQLREDRYGLNFDDLIHMTLDALENHQEVRRRTAQDMRFLLIDEFQDTDSIQYQIATLLCNERGGPQLFIVGDAKQSIYFFRGAEVEVFAKARRTARQTITLATNFRSLPDVIAFINDFFSRSRLLKAVESPYSPMTAHREPCSQSRIEFLIPPPLEKALMADYRSQEANMVAARIADMCGGGEGAVFVQDATGQGMRKADYSDVAILLRSLTGVYQYERSLREWGIPYTLIAGSGFYMRTEVVDMRNLLALIANPRDEVALLGFLRSPMAGMSDDALVQLKGHDTLASAFHSGKSVEDAKDRRALERGREILRILRDHAELPLPELVRLAVDLTGYEAILLDQFLGTQKASNVRKLLDLAYSFSGERTPRVRDFVRYLDEVTAREIREGEASLSSESLGTVTIMTVHKAKGLEFPIVFLPDQSRSKRQNDSLPIAVDRRLGMVAKVADADGKLVGSALHGHITRLRSEREFEEEARILYVGMTRARDWLILSGAPDPKKSTSFSEFENLYGLGDCGDGDVIEGEGWMATVRRALPNPPQGFESKRKKVMAVPGDLSRRIEPMEAEVSAPSMLSTTRLLNLLQESVPAGATPVATRSSGGIAPALRGDMLHLMFQRWDFRSPLPELASEVCRELCPSIRLRSTVIRDLVQVGESFRQTALGRELAGRGRLLREVPFHLRLGEVLLTGSIDAVLDDGTIIDYKTGERRGKTLERYVLQVQLYAAAHRRLRGALPPRAYLVYVDAGETVEVDVSAQAIEAAVARACEAIRASSSARHVLT